VEESKRFSARSIGGPDALPICAIGVITTPICDEAMDDEACIFITIALFFFCWARDEFPPL